MVLFAVLFVVLIVVVVALVLVLVVVLDPPTPPQTTFGIELTIDNKTHNVQPSPRRGGSRHELGGLYYQPTLLANAGSDSEIAQNEVFGPVLTWHGFGSEAEAIALANGTEYGLAAMLYTREPERAARVSAALVAGTVWATATSCAISARPSAARAPRGSAVRAGSGALISSAT